MRRPLYVYAIVGAHARLPRIAGHELQRVAVGGLAVVAERRMRARSISEKALRDQYDVVARVHTVVEAILPVRFGALVDEDELTHVIGLRQRTLAAALKRVRHRSQMTVRLLGSPAERAPAAAPGTGTEYLLSRAESMRPVISPLADTIRRAVARLVAGESIDPGRGSIELTINHLVPNRRLGRYRSSVDSAAETSGSRAAVIMSGPMPPFAFAPDIWHDA